MGAGKSIPVVSEVLTIGESAGKLIGAAGCAIAGELDSAKKLVDGAGDAWVDYAERQPLAAGINIAVRAIADDDDGVKRVAKKLGHSCEDLVDACPVVGHIKGGVHYALGDIEHGDKCMKDASKDAAIVAATAVAMGTGGAAAPLVAGAASLGSGLAADTVITGCDSLAHGEYRPYGEIAAVTQAVKTGDPNDIADAVLAPIADFGLAAATEFASAKIKAKLKKTEAKKIAQYQDHKLAMKAADTTREAYHEASSTLKRNDGVVTLVKDLQTGEEHIGYSAKPRQRMQHDVANAMNTEGYRSALQERCPLPQEKQNPMGRSRVQNCAEHQAYDGYYADHPDMQQAPKTREVSVQRQKYRQNTRLVVVERCTNCQQFAESMGAVKPELIGKNMTSARWNQLRSTVYRIQVASIVTLEIAWNGGSYILIANSPAYINPSVREIVVHISPADQYLSSIQFILRDGHCLEFGKKGQDDHKNISPLEYGEYVTEVVIAEKQKKPIGMTVSINEGVRIITFGKMDEELADHHYTFEPPHGQHIIGLYLVEDSIIVAYARR